jgi:hypothetical protein
MPVPTEQNPIPMYGSEKQYGGGGNRSHPVMWKEVVCTAYVLCETLFTLQNSELHMGVETDAINWNCIWNTIKMSSYSKQVGTELNFHTLFIQSNAIPNYNRSNYQVI